MLDRLPNDIVNNIFSRLSLQQLVQTSVLSKCFEHTWRTVSVIEVDTKGILTCPKSVREKLSLKIDKVVFLMSSQAEWHTPLHPSKKKGRDTRTTLDIHNLTSRITAWLYLARVRKVDEVSVLWDESLRHSKKAEVFERLKANEAVKHGLLNLFNIPTLKTLTLLNPQSISIPNNLNLPRLQELIIDVKHHTDLGLLLPEPMDFPSRVEIAINLNGDQLDLQAFLELVKERFLGGQISVTGTVSQKLVFKLQGPNLLFYNLLKPSRAGIPQLQFLRQLECSVRNYSELVLISDLIATCPLLDTMVMWIRINLDASQKGQKWILKIEGDNLRIIKLEGVLYIRKDREIHLEVSTPNLVSFDVVLNKKIQLFVKWKTATPRLLHKRIRPCPASEGDLEGKYVGGDFEEEEP